MAEPAPFGEIIYAGAEAVGVPGQRRFRLKLMNAEGRSAALWLEKEQLSALGEAIESVLAGEGFQPRSRAEDRPEPPVFPLRSNVEYQIGQMSMGLYREESTIVVSTMPVQGADVSDDDDNDGISFAIAYDDAHFLREEIVRVVAAGRPPCPLCGGPLDASGHICPKRNGHHPQD